MSTTQEQILLLNGEKQNNIEAISLLNTQINDLTQAIVNTEAMITQYNDQIVIYNTDITRLTANNTTIDDIIIVIGG